MDSVLISISRCLQQRSARIREIDTAEDDRAEIEFEWWSNSRYDASTATLVQINRSILPFLVCVAGGKVTINGVGKDKEVMWNNLVGYIDQIDRLHPWMTVWEVRRMSLCD